MMEFNQYGEATNSIKPVTINKRYDGTYMLFTPEGGLLDSFVSRGPFASFDLAKRNAEMTVGMTMKWKD